MQAIAAQAWVLLDAKQQTYLRGKNTQERREIASLTKMYTLYACLMLNQCLRINPFTTVVRTFDTGVSGTAANLLAERYIALIDLYYGMMLPSGNDAAYILSCYYGFWLTVLGKQGPTKPFRKESLADKQKYYELYSKKFVHFLNHSLVKQELKHANTHFENPHGLPDKNQTSTPWELAMASLHFIKNVTFYKVCGCPVYRGTYHEAQDCFQWANTNILLSEGYKGLKTGFTNTAGGCLASLLEIRPSKYEKCELLVVVLGSSDTTTRFTDTRAIVQDYIKYLKMMQL